MHHGNSNGEGATHQEASVVHHFFMELLIPVGCGTNVVFFNLCISGVMNAKHMHERYS